MGFLFSKTKDMSLCSLRGALYYCLLYPDEIATPEYITICLVLRLPFIIPSACSSLKGLLIGLLDKSGVCVSGGDWFPVTAIILKITAT